MYICEDVPINTSQFVLFYPNTCPVFVLSCPIICSIISRHPLCLCVVLSRHLFYLIQALFLSFVIKFVSYLIETFVLFRHNSMIITNISSSHHHLEQVILLDGVVMSTRLRNKTCRIQRNDLFTVSNSS